MPSTNNKRIAKNTIYLYVRMLVVMGVSLFTVRVVLNALGAEDYGINNVVGGVVTMFSFLTSTMISASQRFFSYSLGKKDYKGLSEYFIMSLWCYLGMIVLIFILAETVGLWFVDKQLNIPESRKEAAFWVYQFSILSFVFHIISIPYNSIVIARERMNVYAIVGLIEVFSKLGIAYLLLISRHDKLIVYAALMFLMALLTNLFYIVYGTKCFEECRIKRFWSDKVFKEVISYSFWSLFGAIAGVFRSQGINILLNIFFNPIVNAARAIAYQVNTAINQFVLNFYKAVQPQITKYYAAKEKQELMKLIFRSSRYCFYLILILSLPVLFETPFLLGLWLKNVPDGAILFTRLVITTAIVDSTAYPLQTATAATGTIKWYQIVTGGLLILNLPVSWIFLRHGFPPETTMYVAIAIALVSQVSRILFSRHLIGMSIVRYIREVVVPIVFVSLLSLVAPAIVQNILSVSMLSSIIVMVIALLSPCAFSFAIGIPRMERRIIVGMIKQKFKMKKTTNER